MNPQEIPDPWLDRVLVTPSPLKDDGTESYLVQLAERELIKSGIPFVLEQICGDSSIRADLVTQNAVVEFKKDLERNRLYQARGQAETYAALLNKGIAVVVGRPPSNQTEELQAKRIAEDFKASGCHVLFADSDGYWLEDLKAILATEGDREFRQSVTTPNSGELLGRLKALEESAQESRQLMGRYYEAFAKGSENAHQALLEWMHKAFTHTEAVIKQSRSSPYDEMLASVLRPKPQVKEQPQATYVISKGVNTAIAYSVIAVTSLLTGVAGFWVGSTTTDQPLPPPATCQSERNAFNWESTNGSTEGILKSSEKLVQCLEQANPNL